MANEIDLNVVADETNVVAEPAEEVSVEATDESAENNDLETRVKELEETLEKERGIRAREKTEHEKELDKLKTKTESKSKNKTQSDDTDYAKLAFLNSQSVTHPDDQQAVLEEADRLKLPITDILAMEHMQAKLKASSDQRVAKQGMPKGQGRTGQATRDDVQYYLDNPDKVPDDLELHNKVIDARMKKIHNDSKFSEVPYIG